ncbi:hypothetical protein [Nocardia cyriacigeorgica]|uniref:hypothetical protein n=1 Tax=Nocardia cyriacigeorgica TaxID=135487 RepID=UPI0018932D68|nr:hypothetical protein [Nocardia cyriacigeorgica]MBF6415190.1 hypothetical protein [Nocardia cyriacigeorgica]
MNEQIPEALVHEVGGRLWPPVAGRITFPLACETDQGPPREIGNADIADLFDAEDIEKYT